MKLGKLASGADRAKTTNYYIPLTVLDVLAIVCKLQMNVVFICEYYHDEQMDKSYWILEPG